MATQSNVLDAIPLDQALESALEQPRERLNVLKFEDRIVRFMKTSKDKKLEFPPLSPFHRLLVHRLSIRFGLEHQSIDNSANYPGGSAHVVDQNNRDMCPMLLTKTTHSSMPKTLLIDLSESNSDCTSSKSTENPSPTTSKNKKILLKRDPSKNDGTTSSKISIKKVQSMSVAEKEKAYAKAKARIFGTSSSTGSGQESSQSSKGLNRCNSNSSISTIGERLSMVSVEDKTRFEEPKKDFESSMTDTMTSPSSTSDTIRSSASYLEQKDNSSRAPVVDAGEWLKDGKVKARRRFENCVDPDFQRHHEDFRAYPGFYSNMNPRNLVPVQNATPPMYYMDNRCNVTPGINPYQNMYNGHHCLVNNRPNMPQFQHNQICYTNQQFQYGNMMPQTYLPQPRFSPQDNNFYAVQLAQQQAAQLVHQNAGYKQYIIPNQQNLPHGSGRNSSPNYSEKFPAIN